MEPGGSVRSFHVENADKVTVTGIVNANIAKESTLHTDESRLYDGADQDIASHQTVKHSGGEDVRREFVWNAHNNEVHITKVYTNSVEGYFSIFKRGMKSVHQHCKEKHSHRYLAEFDFRYKNRVRLGVNDQRRTDRALKGIVGKRLTYRIAGLNGCQAQSSPPCESKNGERRRKRSHSASGS